MGRKTKYFVNLIAVIIILLHPVCALSADASSRPRPLTLTIAHINDTHSHLEAVDETLLIGGVRTAVRLGGFARLKTALDHLRERERNVLLLHAGDAVQGTLYFTQFSGEADFDFLNRLGVDAMTFGNHEFDRGIALTRSFVARAAFPILSANVDFSADPVLSRSVSPFKLLDIEGEKVAVIGVTTADTPAISSPGASVRFRNVEDSVRKTVQDLTARGINKIILLSHIGYEEDKRLARIIPGIDVIVGGHSHTLLGGAALKSFGLAPEGPYPTVVKNQEGKTVLVVQAWRWAEMLGVLKIQFDEKGEIAGYAGEPELIAGDRFIQNKAPVPPGKQYQNIVQALNESGIARIYNENAEVKSALIPFARQLGNLRRLVVATAADSLPVGLNSGPGPLAADAMRWKTGVRIAIQNSGGIRADLQEGPVTMGKVLETLPFGNTLVLLNLTGKEIRNALEELVDFQVATLKTGDPEKIRLPYVSGLTYRVTLSAPRGSRVTGLRLRQAGGRDVPLHPAKTYRIVTNSYLANGGDGCLTFKNARGDKYDTGFIDADAMAEYLMRLKSISNPREPRIRIQSWMENVQEGFAQAYILRAAA